MDLTPIFIFLNIVKVSPLVFLIMMMPFLAKIHQPF